MKWIVYLLVLANVAFFAWRFRHVDEEHQRLGAAPTAAGQRLVLVSEMDANRLQGRAAPAGEDDEAVSVGGPSAARAPRVASAVKPASRREPARGRSANGLEPPKRRKAEVTTPGSPLASMAGGSKPSQRCYTMGPFAADESVDEVIIWLTDRGGRIDSRWGEQKSPSRYWIYLAPMATVDEARAMLRRLKDDGLQDYVRVMRGPMRNAISLGLFSKRESADRRMVQLRNKGYEPLMDIRYKTERARWLDVVFTGETGFSETTFRVDYPSVNWVTARCR